MMGQRPGDQDAYPNKETPQHGVTLSRGYFLGTCEITKEQWQAVMGTKPWSGRELVNEDPKSPAVYISWNDAHAFVTKLAELTGKSFRLPTEAEWEYACRANTTTRFYWGDDPTYTDIDTKAWWRGNALLSKEPYARPVGTMPPNPWGLYDMSGNVSEWCADWHGFYPQNAVTDPTGPAYADHRVLRGGSWISIGGHCRSSRRHHETPELAHSDFGLRVALTDDAPTPGAPEFTDVFVCGTEGINTYRIPSLLLAPDGSLLAFCEARKDRIDDASPTDMILRRSLDGGRTWLPLQVLVAGKGDDALMNPCPVVDRTNNRILLYCMDANKPGPGRNRSLLLSSDDNGVTWTQPIDLASRTKNFDPSFVSGPGVGIQLRGGRLVIPGYAGTLTEELEEHLFSRVFYSDDHGETWTMGPPVDAPSDESQCVELNDGTLMLNMRGNLGMSCRGVALSKNGGESWSKVYWDRALNEAPCQAGIFRYSLAETDGKDRILFSNPDNFGERFNVVERTRMTVRLSYDEGKTWPVRKLIHPGPSSYSTLVRLPDGDIGLLFEGGAQHRREWIRFARFSLAWLTDGSDARGAQP
jgi:sialidase-1